MAQNSSTPSVQSLERAFALLEALSLHPQGAQLTELAAATGLHKSTAHRLLGSLAGLGYVQKADSGRYRLTLRLFEISGRAVDSIDILEAAKPFLEELRDTTGETAHLVVREGCDIVYVYKAESRQSSFRMFSRIGMRRAMYCTAAGKSMLAALPDSEIAAVWQASNVVAHTPHTIVTLEALLEEIAHIRALGYALDNEENELGVRCIAASIPSYTGGPSAAFSLSAPLVRMPDERIPALATEVLAIHKKISGGRG